MVGANFSLAKLLANHQVEEHNLHMIADELKTKIGVMTPEERRELSAYLTKLELENDPDYWKLVRERASKKDQNWINIQKL